MYICKKYVYLYRANNTATNIIKEKDMNNSKFSQLVNNTEVVYEDNLATVSINEQGIVIEAMMADDTMVLDFEEVNVNLTIAQKRTLELMLKNFIKEAIEAQEEEHAIDAYDELQEYWEQREHEERLIFA